MSAFLTLDHVSAATPDGNPLFSDLTLSLGNERMGLVGRNGAGKSTLFSIIRGERIPVSGIVTSGGLIASLEQWPDDEGTVADLLGVAGSLSCLRRMLAGEGSLDDAVNADWTLEDRLNHVLASVRLSGIDFTRPVASLSGGERTRAGLARLLLSEPDVLLLDEPTNNLDADGREAVHDLLKSWKGGALIASHDRDLLEGMDRIAYLSRTGVMLFTGGWSAFRIARDEARARAETDLDRAHQGLSATRANIQKTAEKKARRDKAGRAKRAKGDEPKLVLDARKSQAENTAGKNKRTGERLVSEAEAALSSAREHVEILTPLSIDLPSVNLPAGRRLLSVSDMTLSHAGRTVFQPVTFEITGAQRWVIRGVNGSGKTSLIYAIMGQSGNVSGEVWISPDPIAFLDQHVRILRQDMDLLSNMIARHPDMKVNDAYAILARYAFRNKDARRLPETLSGGELMRAGLATLMSGDVAPSLLILDEPTNHLDIEATEMLENALAGYQGALLIVSHDERFLQAVGVTHEVCLKPAS